MQSQVEPLHAYWTLTKFMRLVQVIEATGRSRTSIYDAVKAGTFPPPIPIGARAVAWDAEAIAQWQQGCMSKVAHYATEGH